MTDNSLCKAERLRSKILIEKMFAGGAKSFSVFPLRIVYMYVEKEQVPSVAILISVPKKRFKKAVDRNRIKRRIREAYRKNKHGLLHSLEGSDKGIIISFICLSGEMVPYSVIEEKMKLSLARISEANL